MTESVHLTPWDARHIFYAQPAHADILIAAIAETMAEYAPGSNDWFFIRYVEGGVHLRWRIHDRLANIREAAFATIAALNAQLCKTDGVSDVVRRAAFPDPAGRVYAPGSMVAIAYEREWDRYGGPDAIAEHEHVFGIASQIAVSLIAQSPLNQNQRARRAIPLMLAAVATMNGRHRSAKQFFADYSAFWRKSWTPRNVGHGGTAGAFQAPDLMPLLAHYEDVALGRKAPNDEADHWAVALAAATGRLRDIFAAGRLHLFDGSGIIDAEPKLELALSQFCHSQIHMMNNRLGLAPSAEIRLSDIILSGLPEAA